jgi:hypothetical protein
MSTSVQIPCKIVKWDEVRSTHKGQLSNRKHEVSNRKHEALPMGGRYCPDRLRPYHGEAPGFTWRADVVPGNFSAAARC